MTQDIKQRVEEALDILYNQEDVDSLHDENTEIIYKLVEDLAAQNEKLVEVLKFYENKDDYISAALLDRKTGWPDKGNRARVILKELVINPTNGDVT